MDTERIRAAVDVARKVQLWVASNKTEAVYFEKELLKHMNRCIHEGVTSVASREQIPQFEGLATIQEFLESLPYSGWMQDG